MERKIFREIKLARDPDTGKVFDFDVAQYHINDPESKLEKERIYIEKWADGSLTLNNTRCGRKDRIFLYNDEWRAVIKALYQAWSDEEKSRNDTRRKWFCENGDKKEHYSCPVTLSVNEAKRILESHPLRVENGRVEIHFERAWRKVCRTDLHDDVGTFSYDDAIEAMTDFDRFRAKLVSKVQFGARVTASSFSIVDSLTDG